MSFSWTFTIAPDTTVIYLSHLTEIRSNINTDRASVGLTAYSWITSPAIGDPVLESHFLELRTALDQAQNANVCSTYYSGHLSSQHASYLSAENASNYGYYSGNYAYCSGRCGGYNAYNAKG
jgi:hypothetical protein